MPGPSSRSDAVSGQSTPLGPVLVTEQMIVHWARAFDPLPFHLDRQAARQSLLGDLAASGWHTVGLALRLIKESPLGTLPLTGVAGVENLKWLRPVFPDDRVSGEARRGPEDTQTISLVVTLSTPRSGPVLSATVRFFRSEHR
jgi:acyl dehydratase